jgi:hypothetical protein
VTYRFTSDGRSRSTGHRWKAGDTVPQGLPITEFMVNAGVVEKIERYKNMTFKELADELRERDLTISGSKREKIDRLINDDKGDK